jgi:hypothetical protein
MISKLPTCLVLMGIMLTGILTSCQSLSTPPPASQSKQQAQVSLLVNLDAPAYIKREGWIDYQPVGFGELVYPTDLLKTEGKITLLCADMQTIETTTGLNRNPCPLPFNGQSLTYDDMWVASGERSVPTSSVPYIIYPRSTTILEPRPLLHWHDTGAVDYTVKIWQGADPIWQQTDVKSNTLMYPSEAPELVAGKDYLLVVTDNTAGVDSTADPNKGLGFQVVSADQRAEIEKQQQAILSLVGLDTGAQKLALALYDNNINIGGRGLWGEACTMLEEVAQVQPKAPAVTLRLGDELDKVELWNEAQAAYKTALIQAQMLKDLESQADALAALWRITGDQTSFNQAVSLYEQIGAKDKADQLQKELKP